MKVSTIFLNFKKSKLIVIGAWREIKTNQINFITSENENDPTPICYNLKGTQANWNGYMSGTPKMLAATEGSEYVGWSRKKCYRLTKAEIRTFVEGKTFTEKMP